MLSHWIRPAGALLLTAACLLLPRFGQAEPQPKTAPSEQPKTLTPDDARELLDQAAQQWTARKGAAEVAHQRFTEQAAALVKARQQLAALKEPERQTVPLVFRAADVEPAIKVARQLADYHAARVKNLEAVIAAIDTLLARGAEFDQAFAAAQAQRNVIDSALKNAAEHNVPTDKVPDALAKKRLDADMERLKQLAKEVNETRDKAKAERKSLEESLKSARAESAHATAMLNELEAKRDTTLASFAFEEKVKGMKAEPLVDEFTRLRGLVAEKTGALKGDAADYAKAASAAAEARATLAAIKEPPMPPEPKTDASLPLLEQAARKLFAVQQQYAARVRTMEEREEKVKALVAALDELEKKAIAYSTTLSRALETAGELATVAAEIERRVGRGDLEAAKVPEGVTAAAGTASERGKLEAEAAAVRDTLAKLKQERDALRAPNPETESIKALTAQLLTQVGERIDLLTDLKKLTADYAVARKDRPDAEQKRLEQRAADRVARDATQWDQFLALDRSKPATDIADLLDAYYRELVELDEKQENLKRQKETLDKLITLTRKEADDIAKLRAVLQNRAAESDAVRKWDDWLAARLTPPGVKAEAGIYHDEAARLNALSGANARRVAALTGNEPLEANKAAEQTKLPATGGEIGQTRRELFNARVRGWTITGIKVGAILLAALILPRLIIFILRRAIRGGIDDAGNPSPVLAPLRAALRIGVWIAALALILSIFGFDVTALVVALAIGVLAVGLAARPMIADVLGSLVIFAERRFKVGDVVRLGEGEPARVAGITWRSTALKNTNGLVVSVPNRKVTETTVENLSRGTETYDTLAVTISTDKDAGKVISVIRAAMAQCKNLSPDHGVTVVSYTQKGPVKEVQYRFWWFLKDYETRNKTRDEVFARIALGLANEDMGGIELTLA